VFIVDQGPSKSERSLGRTGQECARARQDGLGARSATSGPTGAVATRKDARLVGIPARLGRTFRRHLGTDSGGTWAVIPDDLGTDSEHLGTHSGDLGSSSGGLGRRLELRFSARLAHGQPARAL